MLSLVPCAAIKALHKGGGVAAKALARPSMVAHPTKVQLEAARPSILARVSSTDPCLCETSLAARMAHVSSMAQAHVDLEPASNGFNNCRMKDAP